MRVISDKFPSQIDEQFSCFSEYVVDRGLFHQRSLQFELHCSLLSAELYLILASVQLIVLNVFETSNKSLDQEFAELTVFDLSIG